MLRFDYQLTPTHRLTARAASTSALLLNDNVDDHLSNGWDRPTWGQSYVLNSSWALSQRVLNEFRAQYINFDRPRQAKSHFPRLDFPGADLGTRTNSFAFKDEHLLLLRDDFSSYLTGWGGDHSLKLGGEYFAQGIGGIFGTNWFGYYRFPRNPTDWAQVIRVVEANDRAGLQDLLNRGIIPAPANAVFALGDASYWVKPKILGFYLQDDLKVSPALTLNLGVRYDVEIDAAKVVRQTRFLSRPDQQPRGKTDRNNWSPRVGFVYAFNQQRTTIRGGAGRYYDQLHIDGGIQNQVIFNGDTYAQANILYNRDPEFMINPLKGLTLESLIANNIPTNISAMSKTIHVSHADQLSIGAQHQLTETLAVQADIVHTVGRQEQYGRDINLFADPVTREPLPVAQYGRPDPRFGSINLTHYDGRSRYDALQVAATKRFSERYQYQASYILSWSYATAGANLDPTRPIGELYGPSDRDQRHRFVINATAQMPYEVILGGVFFASSGTRFGTDAGRDLNGDLLTDLARYPDGRKWPAVGGLGDSVYRVDLRVSKRVRLFKGVTVEGIGEIFNVLNRRNYIRYSGSQSSQAFLQPLRSTNLQYQPRMGQLAFRLAF
ncbi:MAG: TonB-dependent receptor [Acidobacteria bacterium]|nr:TonB-dependent receptor [Acidobacteriota bacterium]